MLLFVVWINFHTKNAENTFDKYFIVFFNRLITEKNPSLGDHSKDIDKKWLHKESSTLDSFEDEESILPDVKIDVMLGFICDVRSEVSANKAVPIAIVSTIELIF